MTDLKYITTGMFTRFVPLTDAGVEAWRVMHAQEGEVVLSIHAKSVIAQLRKAGYSVAKAKKQALVFTADDEALLAELGA